MTPFLERETDIRKTFFHKFLRHGEVIIYDKPLKNHSDIAFEHKKDRFVDDGGYINPTGEFPFENDAKIRFTSTTQTCFIQGDKHEQRKKTIEIAKNILGEDKVSNE